MKSNSIIKNYIRDIIILNKIDLSEVKGERLYINNYTAGFSAILYLLLIPCLIYLMFIEIGNDMIWVIYIILILVFSFSSTYYFSIALFKNPILILNEDKIYFHKTQKWYSITEYTFDDKHIGRANMNLTYCMVDKNGKFIFKLNNWFLKNEEAFKAKLESRKLALVLHNN